MTLCSKTDFISIKIIIQRCCDKNMIFCRICTVLKFQKRHIFLPPVSAETGITLYRLDCVLELVAGLQHVHMFSVVYSNKCVVHDDDHRRQEWCTRWEMGGLAQQTMLNIGGPW